FAKATEGKGGAERLMARGKVVGEVGETVSAKTGKIARANTQRAARSAYADFSNSIFRPSSLVGIAILFLIIGFVSLNTATIKSFGNNPTISRVADFESRAVTWMANPFIALGENMRMVLTSTVRYSPLALSDESGTATVWDSVESGWHIFTVIVRDKARKFLGVRDYGPGNSTTNIAITTNAPKTSGATTTIIRNIVEQPRTTVINQIDPTLLARITAVEQAIAKNSVHDYLQTDAIYSSVGRSISNSLANISSGGSGTVTSINASGGTTGLSFSGGPVTTSGTLTLSGTLDVDNGGTGSSTAPS
ncbi:MAG: hypothetical protein AAB777_01445, partial [Patescibacteria group bacterium]